MTPEEAWKILENADLLCDEVSVREAIVRLAAEITTRLKDSNPLVVAVMGGSVFFAGNLMARLRFPLEFDYVSASRYGKATSGGKLVLESRAGENVKGRTVLVLDDILDGGETLRRDTRPREAGRRRGLLQRGARGQGHRPRQAHRARFRRADASRPLRVRLRHDVSGAWRNLPRSTL